MEEKKKAGKLPWIVVGLFILIIVSIYNTDEHPQNKPVAANKTATNKASSDAELKLKDKALFAAFYKGLKAKIDQFDSEARPYFDALTSNDYVTAAQIAKNRVDDLRLKWGDISRFEVPNFNNQQVSKDAKEGRDYLAGAYLNKVKGMEVYLEFIEHPESIIAKAAEIKDMSEKMQGMMTIGFIKMEAVAEKLGVETDLSKAIKRAEVKGKKKGL